jgi:chorismate synthase
MMEAIEDARREGDSLGGVVEVVATGVPGVLENQYLINWMPTLQRH